MIESRKVVEQIKQMPNVDERAAQKALDFFDQRLVKHVANRSKDFKNMGDICLAFLGELCEAGASADCPSHWAAHKLKRSSDSSAPKRAIAQLSPSGFSLEAAKESLQKKGCIVGALCVHSRNDLTYAVKAIDSDGIIMQ